MAYPTVELTNEKLLSLVTKDSHKTIKEAFLKGKTVVVNTHYIEDEGALDASDVIVGVLRSDIDLDDVFNSMLEGDYLPVAFSVGRGVALEDVEAEPWGWAEVIGKLQENIYALDTE